MKTEIVGVRFTTEERQRLQVLADRCERTPSDVIRQLVRRVDPAQLGNGIPPSALLDQGIPEPERTMVRT